MKGRPKCPWAVNGTAKKRDLTGITRILVYVIVHSREPPYIGPLLDPETKPCPAKSATPPSKPGVRAAA